jgi:hypothetical protein
MFSITYKPIKTAVSFHFVPIPGASNFAHGVNLRLNNSAPGPIKRPVKRPGVFVSAGHSILNGFGYHRSHQAVWFSTLILAAARDPLALATNRVASTCHADVGAHRAKHVGPLGIFEG